MNPLTVQIAIKNNETTIESTLSSLISLDCDILIADLGCRDKTSQICESFGFKPVKFSWCDDWSRLRNEMTAMSQSSWQLLVQPWEMLIAGHENIIDAITNSILPGYCQLIQDDIITKPIRLWKKNPALRFVNPVFEKLNCIKSQYVDFVIWSDKGDDLKEQVKTWHKNDPLANEPYYFEACTALQEGKYQEFLSLSNHYMIREKENTISLCMTRYYQAIVHLLITGKLDLAVKNLIYCLGENVLMAEFWCLLGDIHHKLKEFNKAICFYENALLLGSKRLRSDKWPMQISKYEQYPQDMIDNCKVWLSKTNTFISKPSPIR